MRSGARRLAKVVLPTRRTPQSQTIGTSRQASSIRCYPWSIPTENLTDYLPRKLNRRLYRWSLRQRGRWSWVRWSLRQSLRCRSRESSPRQATKDAKKTTGIVPSLLPLLNNSYSSSLTPPLLLLYSYSPTLTSSMEAGRLSVTD